VVSFCSLLLSFVSLFLSIPPLLLPSLLLLALSFFCGPPHFVSVLLLLSRLRGISALLHIIPSSSALLLPVFKISHFRNVYLFAVCFSPLALCICAAAACGASNPEKKTLP
jgi:hypothetical protein